MGGKVRNLVGKNGITEAKFTTRPSLQVPQGYTLGVDYVMIVYCDDRNKSEVRKILEKQFNASEMFWKYDRETWMESLNSGEKIPDEIQEALKKLEL